jgi:hypothetical protein
MKTVIIVSKCTSVYPDDTARFKFKGALHGKALRSIVLSFECAGRAVKGKEYIMYVRIEDADHGTLKGVVLKMRRLPIEWDKKPVILTDEQIKVKEQKKRDRDERRFAAGITDENGRKY